MTSVYLQQESKIARIAAEWQNKPCNISELARTHNVPYQQLRHCMVGKHPVRQSKAPNATLSQAQERGLVDYIDFLDTKGSKARLHEVRTAANRILYNSGQDQCVSDHFVPCFLKKHPEFLVRKQKPLVIARKNAHDLDALQKCFWEYKRLQQEYRILDDDTWNFDETRFRIGVGCAQLVVTRDAHRKLLLQDLDNRESLTSVETINATSKVTPPYMILSDWQMLEKWFEATDLDENASFDTNDTWYSNDKISMRWLEHFNKNAPPKKKWKMLVMDGHGSHTHEEFEFWCQELRIIPFLLLAHTTHICQPLDMGCFQPLKHYHCETIDKAVQIDHKAVPNKTDFLATFQKVWEQAFTPATIKSAFQKTGLVPYFLDIVLDKIQAEVAKEKSCIVISSPTPPPTLPTENSMLTQTPTGTSHEFMYFFHMFDCYIKQGLKDKREEASTISLLEVYNKFSKEIEAKLHVGALAEDWLSAQTKAVAAQKKQNQNNRRLNVTGRLTVGNARVMIREKNLRQDAQKKAAKEKKQVQDFKA